MFFWFFSVLLSGWIALAALTPEEELQQMSVDEKVGALFAIPVCPERGQDHWEEAKRFIAEHHIRSVILKQGTAFQSLSMVTGLQSSLQGRLLVLQDAEWGLAMRIFDAIRFPRNMTLGAIADQRLLFSLGKEIGRQCRLIGIDVNLAPDVDVNSNPKNPIIHMRSYGDKPQQVADRAICFLQGMQQEHVLACVKHFPDHGNVAIDSHYSLPTIPAMQLMPFKKSLQAGAACLMSGHLFYPPIDSELPVSLSQKFLNPIVREEWNFSGLIISDALNMGALTKDHSTEEIALLALAAGNDLLLYADHVPEVVDRLLRQDIPQAIAAVKSAVVSGSIEQRVLDQHVLRLLQAKERARWQQPDLLTEQQLFAQLHTTEALQLNQQLYRLSLTQVPSCSALLPLDPNSRLLCLHRGSNSFASLVRLSYPSVETASFSSFTGKAADYDAVIIALHGLTTNVSSFMGLSYQERQVIDSLAQSGVPTIIALFGSPYTLTFLPKQATILVAYEDVPCCYQPVVDALFTSFRAPGVLPISLE